MIEIQGPNGIICRPIELEDWEPLYETLRVWPDFRNGMSPEAARKCLSRWMVQNDKLLGEGLPFTRASWGWLTMCAQDDDGPLGFTRTNIVGKDHGRPKMERERIGTHPDDDDGPPPPPPEPPDVWAQHWIDRGVDVDDLVISSYYPTNFETGFIHAPGGEGPAALAQRRHAADALGVRSRWHR